MNRYFSRQLLLVMLLLSIFSFSPLDSFCNSILGGEVSYRCLGSRKYIFTINIYRDCSGAQFTKQVLTLRGLSLRGAMRGACVTNNEIDCYLKKIAGQDALDISQMCVPIGTIGPSEIFCKQGPSSSSPTMSGAISKYTFESCEIDFSSIKAPNPGSYYIFYTNLGGLRKQNKNIRVRSISLRVKMHDFVEDGNPSWPSSICDNSPTFITPPQSFIQNANGLYKLENLAKDSDHDSLSYKLDLPWSGAGHAGFVAGYSQNYPFNGYVSLDSVNGTVTFNPQQVGNNFVTITVQSWRNRKIISEVTREISLQILPIPSNYPANADIPSIRPPFSDSSIAFSSWKKTVEEGDTISFVLAATDSVPQNGFVSLYLNGSMFTTDYSIHGICPSNRGSCAYLTPAPPIPSNQKPLNFIQRIIPLGYGFRDVNTSTLKVTWATDSSIFRNRGTVSNYNFRIHATASDDQCPFNLKETKTIELTVLPKAPYLKNPKIKKVRLNENFHPVISWDPNLDSSSIYPLDTSIIQSLKRKASSFKKYIIYRGINGIFDPVDSISQIDSLKFIDYSFTHKSTNQIIEYFVKTISGALKKPSLPSGRVGSIFLEMTIDAQKAKHVLSWSRAIANQVQKRYYQIYRQEVETAPGIWKLAGSTSQLNFEDNRTGVNFSDTVLYRVELVDSIGISCSNVVSNYSIKTDLEIHSLLEIQIAPNPSNRDFSFFWRNNRLNKILVEVYNPSGKLIEIDAFENGKRFGRTYPKGLYFVKINSGAFSVNRRIIKY